VSVLEVLGIAIAACVGGTVFVAFVWFRFAETRCQDCGSRYYARNIYSSRDPWTGRREILIPWRLNAYCPRCLPRHMERWEREVEKDLIDNFGFSPDEIRRHRGT